MLHESDKKEISRLLAAQDYERERRYTKAMSIRAFCNNNDICPSTYFNLKRKGLGPREMLVGNRVLITREAQAEWRCQREEEARRPSSAEVAEVLAHNQNVEGVSDSLFGDCATSQTFRASRRARLLEVRKVYVVNLAAVPEPQAEAHIGTLFTTITRRRT